MGFVALEKYPFPSNFSDAGQQTAIAVEATAGDKFTYTALVPMLINRVGVLVTVTVADMATTPCSVAFDKRVTYGSDTGRVEQAVVKIVNGYTAGTIVYKDVQIELDPGQQLVVEQAVAGVGGTEAGDWLPVVCGDVRAEVPGNLTNMLATT